MTVSRTRVLAVRILLGVSMALFGLGLYFRSRAKGADELEQIVFFNRLYISLMVFLFLLLAGLTWYQVKQFKGRGGVEIAEKQPPKEE